MNGVPAPGTLRLAPAEPNPNGVEESQLYLIAGDATDAPIQKLEFASGVALPTIPGEVSSPDFSLRIYHFNDLHGHFVRFSPEGVDAIFSRIAWQIRSARHEYRGNPSSAVLVISAGDDCSGSIFDEILTDKSKAVPTHPGYQLYSTAGVDVGILGNHDFDSSLPFLAKAIGNSAHFPILAANLKGCQENLDFCHPAAILCVKGIRIGLIGLVTRAETRLDPAVCQIVDPIPVVNNLVPILRPLCDVLIIVSHLGYSLEKSTVPMADAGDVELARSLPHRGVDLIVGGHSHSVLNMDGLCEENIINGIPIVQTGANGEYLGQVDITIRGRDATVTDAYLIPVERLPVEQTFEDEAVQPFVRQARDLMDQQLGQVEDIPELSTKIVLQDFAKRELAFANFVTDALVDRLAQRGKPVDFAMIDASALQCGLPYGELTFEDCFEVMPYADIIRIYQITGRQLHTLLSDNAIRIDRPGEAHTERGFLQFSRQLRYSVYLGQTRADACPFGIYVDGISLAEQSERVFLVATSGFSRELAARWETEWPLDAGRRLVTLHEYPYTETDILLRHELVTYIREHGGVTRASGAECDGRLQVKFDEESMIKRKVHEFIDEVSGQNHAMAGAVIALSAAQATALGHACVQISLNKLDSGDEAIASQIETLAGMISQLLEWCDRDANAIAEFVALRESGQELAGQQLLCQAPAQVSRLSVEAANILKNARTFVCEQVQDDLEMSISLLVGTARAALLLLDSNLRIWPEAELLAEFEPVLAELESEIENIQPKKRIRG